MKMQDFISKEEFIQYVQKSCFIINCGAVIGFVAYEMVMTFISMHTKEDILKIERIVKERTWN